MEERYRNESCFLEACPLKCREVIASSQSSPKAPNQNLENGNYFQPILSSNNSDATPTFRTFVKNCRWVLKTPLGSPVVPSTDVNKLRSSDRSSDKHWPTRGKNQSCVVFRQDGDGGCKNMHPIGEILSQCFLKVSHSFPDWPAVFQIENKHGFNICLLIHPWYSIVKAFCAFWIQNDEPALGMSEAMA